MTGETYRLWYVKRAEQVAGPFPTAAVAQDLAVGRLSAQTLLSTDQITWTPAAELDVFGDLLRLRSDTTADSDLWEAERRQALHRWADQRRGADRRSGSAQDSGRPAERRQRAEPLRKAAEEREPPSRRWQRQAWLIAGGLALVVCAVLLLATIFGPGSTPEIRLLK